jgi:uncharacterized protein YjcR
LLFRRIGPSVLLEELSSPYLGNVCRHRGGYESNRQSLRRLHWSFQKAKKCGAKPRSGWSCRNPAMKNGRCRLHGGKSTGAPKGNKNAFKHGRYSREAIEARKLVRELIKLSRQMIFGITSM